MRKTGALKKRIHFQLVKGTTRTQGAYTNDRLIFQIAIAMLQEQVTTSSQIFIPKFDELIVGLKLVLLTVAQHAVPSVKLVAGESCAGADV